jgi:hypothetical protein
LRATLSPLTSSFLRSRELFLALSLLSCRQLLTSPSLDSLPTLIPGFNTLHAMALLWLRPSKQIRAPLYSLKQARQRRNIIARYGVLFYLNFAIFLALIIVSRIRCRRARTSLSLTVYAHRRSPSSFATLSTSTCLASTFERCIDPLVPHAASRIFTPPRSALFHDQTDTPP